MSQEAAAIYTSILEQVMVLEKSKKELSKQVLINTDNKRLELINKFLGLDLHKHQLFEQAAVLALNNHENMIISHLNQLYEPFGSGEIIDKIRKEIGHTRRFLEIIDKAISKKELINFTERRMVKEISKYVLAQCRIYVQLNI